MCPCSLKRPQLCSPSLDVEVGLQCPGDRQPVQRQPDVDTGPLGRLEQRLDGGPLERQRTQFAETERERDAPAPAGELAVNGREVRLVGRLARPGVDASLVGGRGPETAPTDGHLIALGVVAQVLGNGEGDEIAVAAGAVHARFSRAAA